MPSEISDKPWVSVTTLPANEQEQDGLRLQGELLASIPWSSILRVAVGYEIHPIAIADWDFWAFQGSDSTQTWWVYDEPKGTLFSKEIERRFPSGDIPARQFWEDQDFCILTFVIWPMQERGIPMYRHVKRHWWSWNYGLAYFKLPSTQVISAR
jgi:hypothetical protein